MKYWCDLFKNWLYRVSHIKISFLVGFCNQTINLLKDIIKIKHRYENVMKLAVQKSLLYVNVSNGLVIQKKKHFNMKHPVTKYTHTFKELTPHDPDL